MPDPTQPPPVPDRPAPAPPERTLDAADLAPTPMAQFARWWRAWLAASAARSPDAPEPEAVALATAGAGGAPSARMVLLKGHDDDGFVFYTNQRSRKADDLAANPRAALLFHWPALQRQVRAEGSVSPLDDDASDAYFATRARSSQLGAWASPQSAVLPDRAALDARLAEVTARFEGGAVPRPPHWGGYRLTPESVEFWQGRFHRLHDRLRYRREADGWRIERLAP